MQFNWKQERTAVGDFQLDLTSLIDVVFLLLLFFMISTTFIVTPGISVDLPTAGGESISKQKEDLVISVTKQGGLVVENRAISWEEFEERLKHKGSLSRVVIRADRAVKHGLVVKVMDTAKSAGIPRIAIATEQERTQRLFEK